MSAYGLGPFENDDALEFLDEVGDAASADRPVLLRAALDQVLHAEGVAGAVERAEAIAAAAVVARVLQSAQAAPEAELPDWVTDDPPLVDARLAEVAGEVTRRALGERWQHEPAEDHARLAGDGVVPSAQLPGPAAHTGSAQPDGSAESRVPRPSRQRPAREPSEPSEPPGGRVRRAAGRQ